MGSIMVLSVLFPSLFKKQYDLNKSAFSIFTKLKNALQRLFTVRSFGALFWIGILNGFLPCGLVYIAIAGAIGTQSLVQGILFMVLFGLGTIPMLLVVSILGNLISISLRNKINKLIPYVIVFVGIVFILRGLNLGIPFLSPPEEKIKMKFDKELKKNKAISYKEAAKIKPCCSE